MGNTPRKHIPNEIETQKKSNYSNLTEKILEGLFTGKEGRVRREAYLERNQELIGGKTRSDVEFYVKKLFEVFEIYKNQGVYLDDRFLMDEPEAVDVYKQISELLIISGVAELITAGDWSVNRMNLAERSHGFQENGFSKLQTTLAAKYHGTPGWDTPIHLHKGPGNGILPFYLLKSEGFHKENAWKQIGVGDKLYFPLEEILFKFIGDTYKDDKSIHVFVGVLASILKVRLKKRWFEAQTASIQKWKRKSSFCDVNDIFIELQEFLKDPKEEILQLFNPHTGQIKTSQMFEFDSSSHLKVEVQGVLLRLLGYSKEETTQKLVKTYSSQLRGSKKPLRGRIQKLRKISNLFKKRQPELLDDPVLREIKKLTKGLITPEKDRIKNSQYRDSLFTRVKDYINDLENILSRIEGSIRATSALTPQQHQEGLVKSGIEEGLGIFDTKIDPLDFVGKFFTPEFARQFSEGEMGEGKINLNQETSMYFGDFSLGYFTDIPEVVDSPVNLISATRSDSHETEAQFYQDIHQNLQQLVPGGVITTDGSKASFSSIYRFHEIKKAIKDLGENEYKAEVVVDAMTRRPISVFIQRRHEKGYLSDEEKKGFFDKNIDFESLDDTIQRPYIKIVNKVRRGLLDITQVNNQEGQVDIFESLQADVKRFTEAALMDKIITKRFEENSYYVTLFELYNEAVGIFTEGNIESSDPEILALYLLDREQELSPELLIYLEDENFLGLLKKYKGKQISGTEQQQRLGVLHVMEGGENASMDEKMYGEQLRQLIRDNKSTQVLSSDDIKDITTDVTGAVERRLSAYAGDKAPHTKGSLKPIRPGEIHTYPRKGDTEQPPDQSINTRKLTKVERLPDNAAFLSMKEGLTEKKDLFRARVSRMRDVINSQPNVRNFKPICFISYEDCITNEFMLDELKRIFGNNFVSRNVEIVRLNFRDTTEAGPEAIRHIQAIQKKMQIYAEHGGIIIGGGSWTDAYDNFGQAYKDGIGIDLLSAMETNPQLRQLAVCASYQIVADMIGNKFYKGNIVTEPGMMQFGATNVGLKKVEGEGLIRHAAFEGFPEYFTTAMTHTGWVRDARTPKQKRKKVYRNKKPLDVIAHDILTGHPVAYSAMDDQILGIQWHPEINLKNPETLERLSGNLKGFRSYFEKEFSVGPGTVMHNFLSSVAGPKPHLKADSGEAVLVHTLEFLSRGLESIS